VVWKELPDWIDSRQPEPLAEILVTSVEIVDGTAPDRLSTAKTEETWLDEARPEQEH